MGFLNFFKKKELFEDDLNHLDENGELPWGWIYANKDFLNKIENEYSYFLHLWIDARTKSPKELRPALKSFVIYLNDLEKVCQKKGECFDFWFHNILTTNEYMSQRQKELQELEANINILQKEYEEKQQKLTILKNKVIELKPIVIEKLIENYNILQSDFWKLFNKEDEEAVKEIVYSLKREGKIERVKSGRSFKIHYLP